MYRYNFVHMGYNSSSMIYFNWRTIGRGFVEKNNKMCFLVCENKEMGIYFGKWKMNLWQLFVRLGFACGIVDVGG